MKHVPRQKVVFALRRVGNSQAEIAEARQYLTEAGYQVLEGELPEQVGYRRASDEGKAATETRYQSLNQRAEAIAQSVVNKISALA